MGMKITLLEVNDFKRLKKVVIEPGERNLILIGGNNTHGKSSLLGAMGAALGGKKEVPDDPIRHGAKKASIRVVFDDGELTVRRKFTAKGTSIEVTSNGGVIKSPQKMLDKLVGARFIDPMQFSRLSAKEQREVMLGCVKLGIDLDENIAAEKEAYDERRDLNRDIKKLEAKLDGIPEVGDIPNEISQDSVIARIEKANAQIEKQRIAKISVATLEHRLEMAKSNVAAAREALSSARESLGKAEDELSDEEERASVICDVDYSDELESAKNDLAACTTNNVEVLYLREKVRQRELSQDELSRLEDESRHATMTIETLKDLRTEALAAAEMPIPGLTFDEDGLILNDAPFAQASGAEKLRASIAIAWALKPDLHDIWVEDGALLDEDSLELIREFAEENDLRIWLERVGEGDEEAIIMVDGAVKS